MPASSPALRLPEVPPHAPPLPDRPPYPHPLWLEWLADEVGQPYFRTLTERLRATAGHTDVFPAPRDRFAALRHSPLDLKVVILGQDPYHGPGQAHGLAFSVRPGVRVPPSLANVYKELEAEGFGPAKARDGNLQAWADQGVMLLNTVLTVARGRPGSHRGWGWERFTDAVLHQVNDRCPHVAFLLWGRDAERKAPFLDRDRHLVLTSPHPSPYSAHTGFLGNNHFRQANGWLERHGMAPIDW